MPESPNPEEKKIGRPSDYSDALADAICERIADGESLRAICADDTMPCKATVMLWLRKEAAFQTTYAQARARQAEGLIDEILQIADDTSGDTVLGKNGFEPNPTAVSRSRVQIEARLKLLGHLNPKKYGKKLALEVNDERTPRQLSDAELAEIAAGNE